MMESYEIRNEFKKNEHIIISFLICNHKYFSYINK